jgi:hypothetical protein
LDAVEYKTADNGNNDGGDTGDDKCLHGTHSFLATIFILCRLWIYHNTSWLAFHLDEVVLQARG